MGRITKAITGFLAKSGPMLAPIGAKMNATDGRVYIVGDDGAYRRVDGEATRKRSLRHLSPRQRRKEIRRQRQGESK